MSRKRHTPDDEPHFLVRTTSARYGAPSELARHTHTWHQLIYAAEGVVKVSTEHGTWISPPHWAVFAPAGIAHGFSISGAALLHGLYLRPAAWASFPSASTVLGVSPLLRELIARAVSLGMLDKRETSHCALAELIVQELCALPAASLDLPMPMSPQLRLLAEHIAATPGDAHRTVELAQKFGLGPRTLERRFQAETGLSLGKWRKQARLLTGLEALSVGGSVKAAANAAGYANASAFIAAFRIAFGTTPVRYFEYGGHAHTA